MTNTQTFHCIAKVASEKMPERYKLSKSEMLTSHYVLFVEDDKHSENIVSYDVNAGVSWKSSFSLPGILRDIAGAMGWEYDILGFTESRDYPLEKDTTYKIVAGTIKTRYGVCEKELGNPVWGSESRISAELAAVWQIMHTEYGDYCAGIEREVVGG